MSPISYDLAVSFTSGTLATSGVTRSVPPVEEGMEGEQNGLAS